MFASGGSGEKRVELILSTPHCGADFSGSDNFGAETNFADDEDAAFAGINAAIVSFEENFVRESP